MEAGLLMQCAMVRATLRGDKRQTRRPRGLEELNRYPGQLVGESTLGPLGYRGLCLDDHYVADKAAYRQHLGRFHWCLGEHAGELNPLVLRCPYGGVGNRLWVKETHRQQSGDWPAQPESTRFLEYRATYWGGASDIPWRPSIFLPRWAARLFLEITAVCVERLQAISEEDARMEGVAPNKSQHPSTWSGDEGRTWRTTATAAFRDLWDGINATPKPVRGKHGQVESYVSYPWEDGQATRTHRGKPWQVLGNPFVWVLCFQRRHPGGAA